MLTRSAVGPTRSLCMVSAAALIKNDNTRHAPFKECAFGLAPRVWHGPDCLARPGSRQWSRTRPTKTSTINAPPNARAGRFPVAAPVLRPLGPLLVVILERQITRVARRRAVPANWFGGDPVGSRSRCSVAAALSAVITYIDLLPVQVIQLAGSKPLDQRAAFPTVALCSSRLGCRRPCEASRPQPSGGGASSPHPRGG
jgi:hypothetical protein